MIQISFEPAFDPYHTAFRFLQQTAFTGAPISLDRAIVFDIFVLEPKRALEIRVPNSLKRKAKAAAEAQRPVYGKRPGSQVLFNRMKAIHDAAIQTLVLQGYYELDEFEQKRLVRSHSALPSSLEERVEEQNERLKPLLDFLHQDLAIFSYDGINGIKDRTKLGEFKYDVF